MAENFRPGSWARDEKTDIAVIKIDAKDLPIVQLGDSDSGARRSICLRHWRAVQARLHVHLWGGERQRAGTNCSPPAATRSRIICRPTRRLIPGNSGGPLCDIDGKVIGMNTLINGMNRGLGFAIPVNMAKEIGAELIAGHKIVRPWLGIRIETLGDDPSIRDLLKRRRQRRGRAHESKPTRPLTKAICGRSM